MGHEQDICFSLAFKNYLYSFLYTFSLLRKVLFWLIGRNLYSLFSFSLELYTKSSTMRGKSDGLFSHKFEFIGIVITSRRDILRGDSSFLASFNASLSKLIWMGSRLLDNLNWFSEFLKVTLS